MTSRGLLILAVAALAAIAAGLWVAGRQAPAGGGATRDLLYPGLEGELDSIKTVRIFKAGDERAVQLEHGDAGWTVTERAGYRADREKLRKLVTAVAEARRSEEKTSDPKQYAALEVEDTSGADAKGLRIEFSGPAKPVNLIVGKPGIGSNSQFVRRAGEAPSWLIDRRLDAPTAPDQWLDKAIVDIAADRVQSARVTVKGAKPYTAARDSRDVPDFGVEGLPKGKSLRSTSIADSFSSALAGLVLTDVKPVGDLGAEPPADHVAFKTFDGLVVELEGWKQGERRYIALKASFDAAQAKRFLPAAKKDGSKPAKQDVGAEASKLAARTGGWAYEIPPYRYDNLFKPLAALL
jgi:Domain of unknown function (DUF4340)